MTAEAQTGSEQIELHFCRRCGISIPQGDIDTRRAQPVPGGFICDACVVEAPAFEAAAPPGTPLAARPGRGMQALVLIALLYVVGATSFLLAREFTREPPPAPRTDVATAGDLSALAGRIEALNGQARDAFEELKGNDQRQRGELHELGERVNVLREDLPSGQELARRLDDLEAMTKAAASKLDLVREDVDAARRELRHIRDRAAKEPATVGPVQPKPPAGETVRPPERSQEEIERERLVREYIGTLGDKKASNQTRYNAAVQLGDLRHPDAIPALMKALEEDPYDLVCRAAAWSLGMYGQDAVIAIPALIRQLGGKDGYVGYMCERALGEITKAATGTATSFGFDPTMTQRQRRKVQKDWEEWWVQHRPELMPDAG